MKPSSSPKFHSPLVIDDAKLRRQAAAAAEKLLRRLDRLTQAAEGFYGEDQRLFQNWFQLTFREEPARQESLKSEREKLLRAKTEIEAYARFAKVSPDEAYAFLEEEKLRYELGTPEEKARIEDARRYRARKSNTGKREARAEAREKRRAKADAQAIKEWWAWFLALDREGYLAMNELPEHGAETLLTALLMAQEAHQKEAALGFWDATSSAIRKLASQIANAYYQADLEELARSYRAPQAERPAGEDAPAPLRPSEENLKLLYRKFVRYLHPDARGPGAGTESWQKKMWHEGQEAYHAGNLPALYALYRVVMLRLGKLGELTMGEIRAIAAGLEAEFRDLQRSTKGMRNAPFWKFSKRKDYYDLTKKFRAGYAAELTHLENELSALKAEFRGWRLIAENRPAPRKKKRR